MVDIMDACKSLNISIGTVTKNPEMLKLVLDHLKSKKKKKKWVSMQLKNYLIYKICSWSIKTQQMCAKAILENGGKLKSVPDCYKNQEMCNKAVDNYSHAIRFKKCVIKLLILTLLQ